jgi:DNA-directed RNA polymerase subunit RPC12/RpoP
MPHWNCEDCGRRLYSASRRLKRSNCPVCQGRLLPAEEERARFLREPAAPQEHPSTARSVDGESA